MKISQTKNMPEPELQHNLKLTFKGYLLHGILLKFKHPNFLVERKDNHNFYYDNSWNKFIL